MQSKLIAGRSGKIIVKISKQKEYKAYFGDQNLREYFKLHNVRGKYYQVEFRTNKIVPRLFLENTGIFLPEDVAALMLGFGENNFIEDNIWYHLADQDIMFRRTFNYVLSQLSIFFVNSGEVLCCALTGLQTANNILKNDLIFLLDEASKRAEQYGRVSVARQIKHSADSFVRTAARIQRIIIKYQGNVDSRKYNFRLLKELLRIRLAVEKITSLVAKILYMHEDKKMHDSLRSSLCANLGLLPSPGAEKIPADRLST
ncbi:hypothetical protein NO2_0393 [Candidatus Termititenax persephonae]|uniref:Uncharacterized protein n=1 Tax=Candidatus Termititenax persephonae TaxID=2218525 RepID=A0A388TG48_9BACT|nr:hypothetical protein NO2_0393 [Candidatus Termititenax persephonae]